MSGSGYLTRFEDYYKSSDESGDESDDEKKKDFGTERYGPNVDRIGPEDDEFAESEDEDRIDKIHPVNGDVDWSPEEKGDWVPQSLVDLKMKIKPPKNFKGYNGVAFQVESDDEDDDSENKVYSNDYNGVAFQVESDDEDDDSENKVYSNDYNEVCKFRCGVCGLNIDTEKYKNHINTNHDPSEVVEVDYGDSKRPYDVKTWHRCGICGKSVVFTRVRLRYHVITDHSMAIQDYNDEYMVKRGGGRPGRPFGSRSRKPSGVGSEGGDCDGDVDPRTVHPDDISDDYADIVKIECNICGKRVEKDNFRFMHLKQHGMDMSDYKVSYGEPSVVKNKYHKCHICEQIFVFTRSRLASHLARHKVSVKDYGKKFLIKVKSDRSYSANLQVGEIDKDCMFSNDYEDECSTICKICERSLNYGNLGSHLYQSHATRMKDYVEQFGEPQITKKSYHECAICHETLLFIRYHLVTHVKTKHNMSIAAYNKAHMQLHNVEYCDSNILDKGRKIGTQKAPQWCDGTMYKCPYCFNIYYRYFTFRIHLINSHKMTDTEERSTCVRENEILTDIYRCKICHTQVKRDRMDIEAHLKQAHKTTLKIYSANFENPNCTDEPKDIVARLVRMGVLEEPSEKMCKTPKKLRTRASEFKRSNANKPLVELSSSQQSTNSRTMPIQPIVSEKNERTMLPNQNTISSPIRKLKIPKIKREPSFQSESKPHAGVPPSKYSEKEFVSESADTENDPSIWRERKRKLPATFEDSFIMPPSKDRNTPLRSNSINNFESPKRMKNVESQSSPLSEIIPSNSPFMIGKDSSNNINYSGSRDLRSPTPTNNFQKSSIGDASSLGGFIKSEEVHTIKKEVEDPVVYKCPLHPCNWTCGKEGMRQGPAVLHLLRVHKIQPLEMRERGIKFEKIGV